MHVCVVVVVGEGEGKKVKSLHYIHVRTRIILSMVTDTQHTMCIAKDKCIQNS